MSVASFIIAKYPKIQKTPQTVRSLFAPPLGLEPRTYRLTADRSAIELWWNITLKIIAKWVLLVKHKIIENITV